MTDLSTTTPATTLPMIGWRYSLTRCLGRTALVDIYWARDLEVKDAELPEAHVLLLKATLTLSQLNGFEEALYAILMPFTEPSSPALPTITDSGNDNGTLWLVTPHTRGTLFHEQFANFKDRAKPLNELKPYLDTIAKTVAQLQPPYYGFLEPAALQFHEHGVRFLNAPLVYALRHYLLKHTSGLDSRLTLNSGYISPAVAVGDVAQAEDDVFSLACMSYHFLTGDAPFQKQNTLEAVVRHTQPKAVKRIPQRAREAIQQGLALQEHLRQDSNTAFINQLTKRPPIRILLPTAVAAALAITGFAVDHLMNKAENYLETRTNASSTIPPQEAKLSLPAAAPTPVASNAPAISEPPSTATVPSATPATVAATPSTTPTPDPSVKPEVDVLTTLANEIDKQVALGNKANFEPLVTQIRDTLSKGTDRLQALPLLEKAVTHQQTQAQTLLTNKDIIAAATSLNHAGQWIKEFSLAPLALKQLELEKALKQQQEGQIAIERLLAQAQEALVQGRWTNYNAPQNAALYLTQVLERQPQHPEARQLLLEAIRKQQLTIQQQLKDQKIAYTHSLLQDTGDLITAQRLNAAEITQRELETTYQALKAKHPELVKLDPPAPVVATSPNALSAQDITQAIEQAASIGNAGTASLTNQDTTQAISTPSVTVAATPAKPEVKSTPKADSKPEPKQTVAATKPLNDKPNVIPVAATKPVSRPPEREKPRPAPALRTEPARIKVELVSLPNRAPVRQAPARPAPVRPQPQPVPVRRPVYQQRNDNAFLEQEMRRATRERAPQQDYADHYQPQRPQPNYAPPMQPRRSNHVPVAEAIDELIEVPISVLDDQGR